MPRCDLVLALIVAVLLGGGSSALSADEAKTAAPSIGSWLNSPPDRQAVAFDAYFNRLYFNAEGKVVGRYNRHQKKFEAGDFRPAHWHNLASAEAPAKVDPPVKRASAEKEKPTASRDDAAPMPYPIVPYPRAALPPPEPAKPKPAEIFRGGSSANAKAARSRVRIIEAIE